MKPLTVALALVSLILAACGGAAAIEEPAPAISVTDGRGVEITLDGPAQRIVSLAPSNTEILFAVGAGDKVVGRDEFSDYPEEALAVESIGSTYEELNSEAIVALEPDLILAAGITPPEHIATLEELGLPVFVINNPQDFEGLFANLETVGELTGRMEQTEAIIEDFQARVDAVLAAVDGAEPVSLFYEIDGSDPSAPWTVGSGTFHQYVFELAKGNNIASDIDGYAQLSLEEIVVRDPQKILFAAGPFVPTTEEALADRPGWGDLSAVQQGEIYGVDTDLLDLPGPRLVDGLETVAQILHPERFDQ